jgi:hypothetical protein
MRVHLNERQRTRISASFARLNVRPVTHVNFAISIGTVVPARLRLDIVPSEIVAIVPEYRGHYFMVVQDEIVIVHPRTRRIVAVLPYDVGAGATAAATPAATASSSVALSDDQRRVIRRTIVTRETTAVAPAEEIVVGERVPETVIVREFPETIYQTVPAVRSYRYMVRGGQIYLIDPTERRVIEIIE